MKQLILDYTPYCTRVALVEDGEMIDFSVERASARGLVGNIYKGKVENVISGMKAAFVNIGLERNGFLYMGESRVDKTMLQSLPPNRNASEVSAGDIIMCQVTKDMFGQKGPRLTTDVTLPGYYLVLLTNSNFIGISRKIEDDKRREYLEQLVKSLCPPDKGFIIRSAADRATDAEIEKEAAKLLALWDKIERQYVQTHAACMVFEEASLFERALRDTFSEDIDKIVVDDEMIANRLQGKVGRAEIELYTGERNIMSHFGLSTQINHLCDHVVNMPGGSYIVIDKTEALTVIDVNTGRYVGGSNLEDTVFKTNLVAARCIARQLRIRNISGIVIIDFIDMVDPAHREAVVEELKNALKHDRLKTATVGMTPLGLVELTRKKTRLPMDDFMLQPCKDCSGGFVISDAQLVFMLRDQLVDYMLATGADCAYVGVHPDVYKTVFESNIMHRNITRSWLDKQIFIYADDSLRRERFEFSLKKPGFDTPVIRQLADTAREE